jgi:hypothetical protein
MTDPGLEEPEDDVAEQARPVQAETNDTTEPGGEVPLDVNEADAAEQSRGIELDEDEYR